MDDLPFWYFLDGKLQAKTNQPEPQHQPENCKTTRNNAQDLAMTQQQLKDVEEKQKEALQRAEDAEAWGPWVLLNQTGLDFYMGQHVKRCGGPMAYIDLLFHFLFGGRFARHLQRDFLGQYLGQGHV